MIITLKLAWTGYRYKLYNDMYSFKSSTIEKKDDFKDRIIKQFNNQNVIVEIIDNYA